MSIIGTMIREDKVDCTGPVQLVWFPGVARFGSNDLAKLTDEVREQFQHIKYQLALGDPGTDGFSEDDQWVDFSPEQEEHMRKIDEESRRHRKEMEEIRKGV